MQSDWGCGSNMLWMMIMCWNAWNGIILFFCVSRYCMSWLFEMVASFWMVFWEYNTELFWCLSVAKGTAVVDNSIAEDVWDSEDELTGALSD